MKSDRNTDTATLSDGIETRSLRIDANAKAFKELISGIYQDKSYAITRETMANAVDSHVQAGTPERQFQVHIPTQWEPEYFIRDFGVSMDHEMVMGLYSTLFQSTKDDPNSDESNKFVGKFGLGSKSPFAYTDAFQVTAFLGGEKRIYDIFFDQGLPQIALLITAPTDEHDGILISFGVSSKDCNDFERAVIRAVEGLDVLPEFIGKQPILHERKIIAEGEGWQLLDRTQSGRAEAKQGTVLYPLNYNAVIDCPNDLHSLFTHAFRFDFDIGELDVVTSREALSYDAQTSENIIKRLQAVVEEIKNRIEESTDNAETYWDFCTQYANIRKIYPSDIFSLSTADQPIFKGRRPSHTFNVNIKDVRKTIPATDKTPIQFISHKRFGTLSVCKFSKHDLCSKTTTFRLNRKQYSEPELFSLNIGYKIIVVTEDITEKKRYPTARIQKLIDALPLDDYTGVQLLWIRHTGEDTQALRRLFVAFGRPSNLEVFNLMDIPYTPNLRSYDRPKRAPFKFANDGGFTTPVEDSEPPKDAWVIPMRNGDVDRSVCNYGVTDIMLLKSFLEKSGICEELEVVGVPASSKRVLRENPQWINLGKFLDENLPALFDEDAYSRATLQNKYVHMGTMSDNVGIISEEIDTKEAFKDTVLEEIVDLNFLKANDDDGDASHILIHRILRNIETRQRALAEAEHTDAAAASVILNKGPYKDFSFDTPYADISNRQDDVLQKYVDDLAKASSKAARLYPLLYAINGYAITSMDTHEELLNYVIMKNAQLMLSGVDKASAA